MEEELLANCSELRRRDILVLLLEVRLRKLGKQSQNVRLQIAKGEDERTMISLYVSTMIHEEAGLGGLGRAATDTTFVVES